MFVNWNEILREPGSPHLAGGGSVGPPSVSTFPTSSLSSLPIDHVSRWEGVPLTTADGVEGDDGPSAINDTIKEEDESKSRQKWYQPSQLAKILVPHIILISMLLSYLAIGAVILQRLETKSELSGREVMLNQLDAKYDEIAENTWKLKDAKSMNVDRWRAELRAQMMQVSEIHAGRSLAHEFEDHRNMSSKWTFPTALLYVLTVLTTCGYGEVDVMTNGGKIFAVAFALVGIPLMFITAADIGKFLSETFLKVVAQMELCWRRFLWCCCRRRPAKDQRRRTKEGIEALMDGDGREMGDSLLFPIGAYVSLICLYCSLGALLFTNYEVQWSFIHAFHFGFNLIVTVGLGRIVVENGFFLCMIVAYVIIGLSVVTMCVDLASTHLKAYFTKIHYYGQARSRFLGMSEDIKEMVQLLAAMRNKKGGGKVTWNDVKHYLESEQEIRNRPFIPRDINKYRWVDETSSALSTLRHNSVTSEVVDSHHSGNIKRHPSSRRHPDHPPPVPQRPSVIHEAAGLVDADAEDDFPSADA